jgi:UDP-2,4-diacetamido-2,4,6-trideoxy-beta-L-altropyranose hydrolase
MPRPRILFAPAFSDRSGGGHLIRCLALAAGLGQRAEAIFAVPAAATAVIDRFATTPVAVRVVQGPGDLAAATTGCDALIVDDYTLDIDREQILRPGVRLLMVIDDLANRPHAADIVLDSGYGREPADYAGMAATDALVLTGPSYALIRPAFAVARRRVGAPSREVTRVFLSFGLGDVGGVTARSVTTIRALFPQARVDVALGSGAESLAALAQAATSDPSLVLHVDAVDVAELMASADIGVGAGGGATWERCCLGLPTVAVIVADNQRPQISALAADGVLLSVDMTSTDWEGALAVAALSLQPQEVRRALRSASMAVCDGAGADRAADVLLARLG